MSSGSEHGRPSHAARNVLVVLLIFASTAGIVLAARAASQAAATGRQAAVTHIDASTPPIPEQRVVPAAAGVLRVCDDPNNLPFSNERGEGFENRIAALVAHDLGRRLEYVWRPQRRGFIRNTLKANACDVVMGLPASLDMARTTRPYYRSTYVFVTRRGLHVQSLDDPRLRRLRIAIQITGDDYDNPPAAQALAARHIIPNVEGYTVYGDYSKPSPTRGIVDAVANGRVDVAVVWGPVAGYFARQEPVPLELTPVAPQDSPSLRYVYDMSMGVRRADRELAARLDAILQRRRARITRILEDYGVPLVGAREGGAVRPAPAS